MKIAHFSPKHFLEQAVFPCGKFCLVESSIGSLSNPVAKRLSLLPDTICLADSFKFTLSHCLNFKAMTFESTGFNRIVADKSHDVTLAQRR